MDGLRFAAIAMVFLFHLNGYLTVKSKSFYPVSPTDWLAQAAYVGFHGVELFFVISGFILALPFAAHHLKDKPRVSLRKYYLRRLTRLEPPYFVAAIGLFLLAIWVQKADVHVLAPHLVASLSYLHNLIYGAQSSVIGVAWSLEIEVQFYLFVPLLTLLFAIKHKLVRRFVLLVLIVGILAAQVAFLHGNPRASLSILAYLQFFLVGFLLADVFIVDWLENPSPNFYWDVIGLIAWPLLFLTLHKPLLTHWLFPGMVFVLYTATFRGRILNHIFINRWVTVIGGMCYSIYLIHYEVISAVGRFTKKISEGLPYWLHLSIQTFFVGVAVLVVCGLYFVLLEKPCMRRDWPQRLWKTARSLFIPQQDTLENEAAKTS
ncbi:MAG TPA: acyltransferase [Terriglobales bacterium]|nr:acyltransferase [Terriglobales bacterium]